ncbi:RBP11-like subunits of RNA polymerase [Coniochaeta ligniaria NRRL 30616]|uniref:DNA-directed RNA polymerases I and III subunit RPAC2 n=1 Tax=Coniochaeta ligniaria NRRL 30616 TaxID=1408157 RepID=A0A1J7J1R2_9PEZI|nr:RBP11-like subunits of RNA polymerase [Coniochaeta ligniaria NRRL 30616]
MAPRSKTRADVPEEAGDDATMQDAPPSHQPAADDAEDAEGGEAGDDEMNEAEDYEEEEEEPQRVKLLAGSTATAASFEFADEGHTLGNALRYIIMKNPDVEFCAYAIPHPSEAKMNIRIQTYEGTTAIDALQKGLQDLQELCDVVAEKFWVSRNEFMGESTPQPSHA